jgi:hypothetical protein
MLQAESSSLISASTLPLKTRAMIPVSLRRFLAGALLLAGLFTALPLKQAAAQDAGPMQISW